MVTKPKDTLIKIYEKLNLPIDFYAIKAILRHLDTVPNIIKTRNFIINWYKKNFSVFSFVWDFHLTAERFLNLIYNYDFYNWNSNIFNGLDI